MKERTGRAEGGGKVGEGRERERGEEGEKGTYNSGSLRSAHTVTESDKSKAFGLARVQITDNLDTVRLLRDDGPEERESIAEVIL